MIEKLGPNMARTVMGTAYNPAFEYTLVTEEDGFQVIARNPEDDTITCIHLDPEEADPQRLTPIWDMERLEREGKKETWKQVLIVVGTLLAFGAILALLYLKGG